jgi:hypothetical protein
MMAIEICEACRTHGRDNKCIQILVEKSEGKSPLGRHRHKRENIITNFK